MAFPLLAMLPLIAQGIGMAGQAGQGRQDAAMLKAQGKSASQQGVADADAISREYRQIAGRQAAAMAEGGGSYEGSNAKILAQSETLAMLDRLNTLYHGELRRKGYATESSATNTRTSLLAGAQLLSMASNSFAQGKTMPMGAY
jgi:hypothetical protein